MFVTAILASPANAIRLFIAKLIIDEVVRTTNTDVPPQVSYLVVLIVIELLIGLAQNALDKLSVMYGKLLGDVFIPSLNDQLLTKANQLDLSFFENAEFYDSLSRARQEASFQPIQILQNLIYLVGGIVGLMSLIAVLSGFSVWAIVALLIGAAVSLATQARLNVFEFLMLNWQVPAVRKLTYYFSLLTESSAAKEIRLFGLGDYFRKEHLRLLREQNAEKAGLARQRAMQGVLAGGLGSVIFSLVYGVLVLSTTQGHLSVGDLTLYSGAFQQSQFSLGFITMSLAQIYQAGLFLGNIEKLLSYEPKLRDGHIRPTATGLREGLSMHDVSFTYPGKDEPVLKHVNLNLTPGTVLAIVGENGAGKTTLIKLLCHLYDPTSGEIKLNGISLQDYDASALPAMYSAIFQDFTQYQATAMENIGYGNLSLKDDPEAIRAAARRTGADKFIQQLPGQYETMLGTWFDGARELSTGQWQLIALSRALIRRAPIVILDEPTASLSPTAELEVFQTLREALSKNQIGIIVSHRFSTVRLADKIIVLNDGEIKEQGSHDELMQMGGLYARLYTSQASAYADTGQLQ